jgi:hypothetical protein
MEMPLSDELEDSGFTDKLEDPGSTDELERCAIELSCTSAPTTVESEQAFNAPAILNAANESGMIFLMFIGILL